MDKDIQEYYEARFDMMASKGWKDLMEDTQKMLDAYNKIERLTGFSRKSCLVLTTMGADYSL